MTRGMLMVGLIVLLGVAVVAAARGGENPPVRVQETAVREPEPGSVLDGNTLVCFYGNRAAISMGILGQHSLPALEQRLRQLAVAYDELNGELGVKLCFDYVYLVANASGHPYSHYTPYRELFDEALEFAKERDIEFFVDLQLGYRDVEEEVRAILPLLEAPNVHLALDTEFSMVLRGEGIPGGTLGSMDAEDVNKAVEILRAFVAERRLPPKILMVYQFEDRMLTNKDRLQVGTPGVTILINADGVGFGGVEGKITDYEAYAKEPRDALGIKLFFGQDVRVLTPEEVMGLDPSPQQVVYQ